jgi:non-homologous end joining protein Ku
MTKDLDLRLYHDGYKERIEALVTSKMKGDVAQVTEEKPKKPAAKSMMETLRETAESLIGLSACDDILGKNLNNRLRN